jgi:hypothetical protein
VSLDRADYYNRLVLPLKASSRIRGQYFVRGIPLPVWFDRTADDLKEGDWLNGARIIGIKRTVIHS